jgi:hypothetical protein
LFELGPCFLDGIEVGRVRRQIEQLGSGALDALAHTGYLVRTEIVHDHPIARSQRGAENMVQVSKEDFSICSRLDGHGGDHAVETHRTQDRKDFPVALRCALVNPDTAQRSGVAPGHLGRNTAFIQVNQPFRWDRPDPVEEDFAPSAVLFGVSLGGVERLFSAASPVPGPPAEIWP